MRIWRFYNRSRASQEFERLKISGGESLKTRRIFPKKKDKRWRRLEKYRNIDISLISSISMEGQIECTDGWCRERILVPISPQIPTYVKRNGANRRPRFSRDSPNRFEYSERLHQRWCVRRGKRNGTRWNESTSPIQFVSLTIGPCLRQSCDLNCCRWLHRCLEVYDEVENDTVKRKKRQERRGGRGGKKE